MDMRPFAAKTFLKTVAVSEGPLLLWIAEIKPGKYDKPDIHFESGEILSLNATNTAILVRAYGPELQRLHPQAGRAFTWQGAIPRGASKLHRHQANFARDRRCREDRPDGEDRHRREDAHEERRHGRRNPVLGR